VRLVAGALPAFGHLRSLYLFNYSVQVKLYNPNDMLSSTSNKRFSFPNIYHYSNLNLIGLTLNGLSTSNAQLFNFSVEPSYAFNNNSFVITLLVDPSMTPFNLLTYSILALNSAYPSLLDLQSQCTPSISQASCPPTRP
jgi:hypothetical protein